MKIYEIGTGYTPIPAKIGAATEIVVEELTRALRKKSVDATIVDISAEDRKHTDLPIIEVDVPRKFTGTDEQLGIAHKLKRVIYSISLAKCLKKLIKNGKDVVLHFHNQYNLFFFIKLSSKSIRRKCKILYTNHSYIWHGEWKDIEQTVKKRYFQEIASMKAADRVFVLNQVALDNIVDHVGIDKGKIQLIDNGVNTEIYTPIENRETYKKEYGLEGKRVFIQVGSVCDRKNQYGALHLLLPLMKRDPDVVFCYAGGIIDSTYQERIEKLAVQEGVVERVRYFGEIKPGEELNRFYNLGDAMVFPSKAEGFSLVILEAMSAGIPVIINKNLEFKLSSKCLKYVDEYEFLRIIDEKILDENERQIISDQSRKVIELEYSWNAIAEEYFKCCED